MKLLAAAEESAFRREVRDFLRSLPPDMGLGRPFGYEHSREVREVWTRTLGRRGWLVPHWTPAWGGQDWPPMFHYILAQELCAHGCPEIDRIGTDLVGPILQSFGSQAQQQRHLPRILDGQEFWCQGFSEAGAGSDLAQVRTAAQREGDFYRVNGHKLWTTQAHEADMMFALVKVRTGASLQQGHTFLLIDMHADGVAVRPIITLDKRHHINEVTLQDVRVPIADRVGEEGKGWSYARSILGTERMGAAGIPHTQRDLGYLRELAHRMQRDGHLIKNEPLFRHRLAQLEIEVMALEFLQLRVLHASAGPERDALGCVLKLRGTQAYQRVSDLMMAVAGARATALVEEGTPSYEPSVAAAYLFRRSATIAGGTSEIQRNMIAALALQM
jgi:alkylation response protein AidB-like acyl-CoA dehydrogenase